MKYVFNRINEHFERTFESAIPQGFSSTQYILQGGVRWCANCACLPQAGILVSQFRVLRTGTLSEIRPATCAIRYRALKNNSETENYGNKISLNSNTNR